MVALPLFAWRAAYENKEYDRAAKELDSTYIEQPGDPYYLYNRAHIHYEQKNFKEAAHYFKEAAGYKEGFHKIEALINAGNSFAQERLYKEALSCYEEVLSLDPDHKQARHNRDIIKKILEEQDKKEQENKKSEQDKNKNNKEDTKDTKKDREQNDRTQENNKSNNKQDKNQQDKNGSQEQKQDQQSHNKNNNNRDDKMNDQGNGSEQQERPEQKNGDEKNKKQDSSKTESHQKKEDARAMQAAYAQQEQSLNKLKEEERELLQSLENKDKTINRQIVMYNAAAAQQGDEEHAW